MAVQADSARPTESVESAYEYYKNTIDFMKWTTSLATGSVLWVAKDIAAVAGVAQWLVAISEGLLAASIVVGVVAAAQTLLVWSALRARKIPPAARPRQIAATIVLHVLLLGAGLLMYGAYALWPFFVFQMRG
jgi:hypothetical protein